MRKYGVVLTLNSPEEVMDSYFPPTEDYTIHEYAKVFSLKRNVLYKYLREIDYLNDRNKPSDAVVEAGVFVKGETTSVINNGSYVAEAYKPKLTNYGVKHLSSLLVKQPEVAKKLMKY